MKKWLSVLLAAVMLLAMAGIAGAEVKTPTGTITVNKLDANESVDLYQVIRIVYDGTHNQYNNAEWTKMLSGWDKIENLNPEDAPKDDKSGSKAFYEGMFAYVMNQKVTPTATQKAAKTENGEYSATFTGCEAGSYLIVVHGGAKIHQPYLTSLMPKEEASGWTLSASVDASQKAEMPRLTKEAKKKDIGVTTRVTFEITTTIPKYAEGTKDITYWISDQMDSRLQYDEKSLKVKKGETDITGQDAYKVLPYDRTVSEGKTGLFKLVFDYEEIKDADKITVTYDAIGTENIKVGEGHENEATFEWTSGSDSKTDKVYTYGLKVIKKDGRDQNKLLKDVEFNLKGQGGAVLKFEKTGNVYKPSASENASETLVTDENGLIQIDGLALGDYTLVETKAQENYHKVSPVTFTLAADSDKPEQLAKDADAYYEIDVLNYKGIQLPSTGGMGTTIFMVAGIGVMACAVAALMLVLKRQKKNEG